LQGDTYIIFYTVNFVEDILSSIYNCYADQKFPASYDKGTVITLPTRDNHWSLFRAR